MSKEARILVAEDDPQMQLAIKGCLSRAGYDAVITPDGKCALEQFEASSFDLVISDQRMPEMGGQELLAEVARRDASVPFVMITAYGTISQAVEAMQLGAADFLTKPFSSDDLLRVVERVLSPEARDFQRRGKKQAKGRAIITNDPLMIRILEVAEAVARSDATVLVQGESGTGKELIARLVHSSSARHNQPFIAVNCAALPSNLLESELFGHEKGSFTGAMNRKIGKFELAHGGTILLDEVSEMEMALQAKLLRVLQEREIDRVGGRDPVPIDVRVIATTNRNLEEDVRAGKFRTDLFYRLNVIPITLPPLRQRKGDVKLLVNHFINESLGATAPKLPSEVMQTLEAYSWPGNVRELQNAVERAAILSRGREPQSSDFLISGHSVEKITIQRQETAQEDNSDNGPTMIKSGITVAEMEKALIFETLRATDNNRTKAAELLGISIRTLRNKLAEYRVDGEA